MALPISQIIKDLENPHSIIGILKSLHDDIANVHKVSKSNLKHLISRTINLVTAHQLYYKWSGITIIQVLGDNYVILSDNGVVMFDTVIKALETTNDSKVVVAAIECLNHLCNEIRGKPTLTREIMTPKLPLIIQLYMKHIDQHPDIVLKSLNTLITNHPVTFRPFANRLNSHLLTMLKSEMYWSNDTQHAIYQAFTVLPIIEKNEPEMVWNQKFNNVIIEIVDILSVFDQLLNMDDHPELTSLMSLFKSEASPIFPSLQIDLSEPGSLFQISNRLKTLLHITGSFLTTPLKFPVTIPFGKIIVIIEIIFNLNINLLSFKRDIRDDQVKHVIEQVICDIQLNGLELLQVLAHNYSLTLIMYLNNLLALLETSIPISDRQINSQVVLKNEVYYVELLKTVYMILDSIKLYTNSGLILPFMEVGLLLVEPRASNSLAPNTTAVKKHNKAIPMADLLSHSHLFHTKVSDHTVTVVRKFMTCIVSKMDVPANQYYKVMRYLIIEAIKSRQYNYNKYIPEELTSLLKAALLYPMSDKVSILPIIASVMNDDTLISVFTNPRFPPLPILIRNHMDQEEDTESEKRLAIDDSPDVSAYKKIKLETSESSSNHTSAKLFIPTELQEDNIDESKIFKPVLIDSPRNNVEISTNANINNVKNELEDNNTLQKFPEQDNEVQNAVDDDSDFEVPDINIDDSDEE